MDVMANPYRLIIAGGRDFNDYVYLRSCCLPIVGKLASQREVIILSGHVKGADLLGDLLPRRRTRKRRTRHERHAAFISVCSIIGAF